MIDKRLILLCITWLCFYTGYAQNMEKGFKYLETGKYVLAKTFFEEVLQEYPQNKTARLCYGRAVGLSGEATTAVTIFTQLRREYPNDFEIKLNYAESLLWNKEFVKAKAFYEQIVAEDDTSFPAVLGYANTLSNLKEYEKALLLVNNALALQKGNPNAMISRKYIRLGYAGTYVRDRRYEDALTLMDKNLEDFPEDRDTQLNKINVYLLMNKTKEAGVIYRALAKNAKDSIAALAGLSLIAHKEHKEKVALKTAKEALDQAYKHPEDTVTLLNSQERYIQALTWNGKYVKTKQEIDKLFAKHPDNPRVLAMESSLGMYTSDFKTSITNYKKILQNDSTSFDGNLGIANAYRAVDDPYKSYEYAYKTLKHFPKQIDAQGLIEKLNLNYSPFIEQKTSYTIDNGDNEAWSFLVRSEVPFSTRFLLEGSYSYRNTKNEVTNDDATSHTMIIGGKYKLYKGMLLTGRLGIIKAEATINSYSNVLGEVFLKMKPFRLQNLELGYKREIQEFNAALLDREIMMDNFILNYNLNTNFNLGWYTQYIYTTQSDDNKRNLLFTSLYYKVLRRPSTKVGINYQYITFKDQVPTIYFSPSRFNVVEVFADLIKNSSEKKAYWYYGVNAAAGYQFIEDQEKSTTFRIEGKLGYQFSNRFRAHAYAKHSNIASATAAGFKFTEIGLQLKWYLTKKPLFNHKIIAIEKSVLGEEKSKYMSEY